MKTRILLAVLLHFIIFNSNAQDKPNIIFIECDDLMPRFLNKVGDGFGITPNIDKLASKGVYFKNSVAQAPMCGPSRNGLLTNKYPHELGFYRNGHRKLLPSNVWTFPKVLKQNGYTTAYIGKSHMRPTSKHQSKEDALLNYGFDYVKATGERYQLWKRLNLKKEFNDQDIFIEYLKKEIKYEQFLEDNKNGKWSWLSHSTMENDAHYLDGYTTLIGTNYIKEQEDTKDPFFLWFNFCLPHDPYDAPTQYQEAAKNVNIPQPKTNNFGHEVPEILIKDSHGKLPSDENLKIRRTGEVANVMFMDKMIGNLIKSLKENNLYENTIIFFFSDHSIFLGNHGIDGKGSLFEESILASLIVSFPKEFDQNVVSEMPVELMDLIPTTFDLAGIKSPELVAKNGISIVPTLKNTNKKVRKYAISEIWQAQAVSGSRYRLIVTDNGDTFLYDHKFDPFEMTNIALEKPFIVKKMQKYLIKWKNNTDDIIPPHSF